MILDNAEIDEAEDIAGDIAGSAKSSINQLDDIVEYYFRDIAGEVAKGIVTGLDERIITILESAQIPADRNKIISGLGMVNNVKNFNTYMAPLLEKNWLTMTIPQKPTSPNQQYLTTLKGRLIIEFLKHQKDKK